MCVLEKLVAHEIVEWPVSKIVHLKRFRNWKKWGRNRQYGNNLLRIFKTRWELAIRANSSATNWRTGLVFAWKYCGNHENCYNYYILQHPNIFALRMTNAMMIVTEMLHWCRNGWLFKIKKKTSQWQFYVKDGISFRYSHHTYISQITYHTSHIILTYHTSHIRHTSHIIQTAFVY